MRQVLATFAVSALALAACGGGDGSEPLRGEAAQRAVERITLSAADLGEGWKQTGTSPPEDDGSTDIDDCLSDEVAAASDDPVAESDTSEFTRGDQPTELQQLQISSVVYEDAELAGGLVDELATADVRACLTETFQDEVTEDAGSDGVTVTLGDFQATEDFADAGDGATRLRSPVELSAEGLTLPATVDLVVVHTGELATALVAFAIGEPVPDADLERWASAVARQQAGERES